MVGGPWFSDISSIGRIYKHLLSYGPLLSESLGGSTGLTNPVRHVIAGTVVGVVLYTGRELRSVMNTSNPRSKVCGVPGIL